MNKINTIKLVAIYTLCISGGISFANGVEEPIPSFYEETGVSRNRDYVNQHADERIDLFTGKLQWHFTDLFIPGNGGLDLRVQRSYNSLNDNDKLWPDYSPVGIGWTMHFGRVLRNATTSICDNVNNHPSLNPVLEMPDGSKRVLYQALDRVTWITTDFWRAECINTGSGGLKVFSPEGIRYDMTFRGTQIGSPIRPTATYYTSKITDPNGNTIDISYTFSSNGPYAGLSLITGARTSDGRSITFNYSNQRLTSITDGNRVWHYVQSAVPNVFGTNFLKEVKRPDGHSWKFNYNETRTGNAGAYSLREVTYPTGGTIDYSYDVIQFAHNPNIPVSTVVKQKIASPGGVWNWVYSPATQTLNVDTQGRFTFSMPPSAAEAARMDKVTVTGPDEQRTHYHVGYNSAVSGLAYLIGFQLGMVSADQVESFGSTAMRISDQENRRPGGNMVLDGSTATPLITSHRIGRSGESFTKTFSNFDAYGNAQTIVEQGTNTRTTNLTYNINTAKWLIRQKKDETLTEGTERLAITRSFDGNGNLRTETRAGVTTSFTYTSQGDLATKTDARGKVTQYSNYFRGIARTENQPEGVTITRVVSAEGNITAQTDGEQDTTKFGYDGINRVTSIAHAIGQPVQVNWGRNTRTVKRGAYQQITTYDGFGREVNVQYTDTNRNEIVTQTFQVDSLGRRIFASYPNSSTGTGTVYDTLGRETAILNEFNPATGNSASFRTIDYSSYGVQQVNERGFATTHKFRAYGEPDKAELISIQTQLDANGPGTVIGRNIAGQMTSVRQDGVTRTYGYDSRFYLTSMTEPETGATIMGRDPVGNMTSRRVGASGTTTYGYDDRNRVTSITYPVGTPSVTKTYYKDDQVKIIDNGVARIEYLYDPNKNLRKETLIVGTKVFPTEYDYNANDAQTSIRYGSGRVVTYAPDAFGRPREAAPYVTSVAYHPTGQASSLTYANGVQTTVGLNGRKWPSALRIAKGIEFFNMSYGYDGTGNVLAINDSIDPFYNRTMDYDPLDRLTWVSGPWGTGSISYDLRGNIHSQSFGSFNLSYAYDSASQRLSSVTGSKSYALNYDVYGNVIGNGRNTFIYNDAANMRCANCGGANEIRYDYNGINQRVRTQKSGLETYFVHGQDGQLLWEETPNNSVKEYIYLGGKQVATRELRLQ